MDDWRFLGIDIYDAYMNMAVDEAILISREKGIVPNTIRLYRWKPSAVSIGYFESIEEVVDLAACRDRGVDVVRRISGGGAIFHDFDGEVTYSVVAELSSGEIPDDVGRSYEMICSGLVNALEILGVKAEFHSPKDPRYCPSIYISRKKISGNAQARRRGVVLQHGTVMMTTDIKVMEEVLKLPKPKGMAKPLGDIVTTLERELGRTVEFGEVSGALKVGFGQAFTAEPKEGKLDDEELELALSLCSLKYSTRVWNFSRSGSGRQGELQNIIVSKERPQ